MSTLFVVGLGNPGAQYSATRHNVGMHMVQYWTKEQGLLFTKQHSYAKALLHKDCHDIVIAYPAVFMNNSGKAIASLLGGMKEKADNLLVIVDDLETKFGMCKLVYEGGTRGHNGLRSIYQSLGTRAFYQLRVGIGRPEGDADVSDFVLSRFTEQEAIHINSIQQEVFRLIQQWIEERIQTKECERRTT